MLPCWLCTCVSVLIFFFLQNLKCPIRISGSSIDLTPNRTQIKLPGFFLSLYIFFAFSVHTKPHTHSLFLSLQIKTHHNSQQHTNPKSYLFSSHIKEPFFRILPALSLSYSFSLSDSIRAQFQTLIPLSEV